MRLGVIGNGVVGRATARAFMEHADVYVWDSMPERRVNDLDAVLGCDLVFVCVPEGAVDDLFVQLKSMHAINAEFVLKSTVPIGTTRRLRAQHTLPIVHSPEFLTARCAVADAHLPARNIIGGLSNRLHHLYRTRFPGVPIICMSSDESEAVKLITNSFFAVKIAYFNEVNEMCKMLNLNWDNVLAGVLSDGRIAHAHTRVPGFGSRFGFGGACLPKDIDQLIAQLPANSTMAKAAVERNKRDQLR